MIEHVTQAAYLAGTVLFILSLKWLSHPSTARRGVAAGSAGMGLAVIGTLLNPHIVDFTWIAIALVIGTVIGYPLSRVSLTAVPQRTALSHAFGGLAAGLVGTAKYFLWLDSGELTAFKTGAIVLEVLLGFLTCTGSLMAAGKLQEVKFIPQRPVTYPLQNVTNLALLAVAAAAGVGLVLNPTAPWAALAFPLIIVLALLFGVLLITAGALDGSSGLILAIIMCKAMNRSFTNVLFGAFGQVQQIKAGGEEKVYKAESIECAGQVLEQANLVVVVPGYGMAVAQAQHKVRELYDQLKKRGITVKFAIHPVAGRMPGHMNVLLAEADIPYTDLVEMDEINPDMPQVDVALVVGANDVVNPAARTEKTSPIYGMPIIDADRARTVFAIKRSKNPGFAGIDNELYFSDKTWMLFGDAKNVIGELVKQLSGGSGLH